MLRIIFVLVIYIGLLEAQGQLLDFLRRRHHQNIIDGVVTDISQVPYQLRLSFLRVPICGAALVSRSVAFTAAHCVNTLSVIPFLYSVQAGINTYNDPLGHKIRVRRIVTDPLYGKNGVGNDFSILFLFREVPFTTRIQPVGLASKLYIAGTPAVISGWGTTEDGVSSPVLRSAKTHLITNDECTLHFRSVNTSALIDETMICTASERQGTCYGDSGGPLVVGNELVGLTSWGDANCAAVYPSVFSNIYSFRPFIQRYVPELFP